MASMQSILPARKMWVTSVAATVAAAAAPHVTPYVQEIAAQYPQLEMLSGDLTINGLIVFLVSYVIGYFTPPAGKEAVLA